MFVLHQEESKKRGFSGGPETRTWHFHFRQGIGSILSLRTKILQKNKRKKKTHKMK